MNIQNSKIYSLPIILLIISFSISFLLYMGFGYSDNNEFTPILYKMIDKNYLPNDWFVTIHDGVVNVRSYFLWLIWALWLVIPNLPIIYYLMYALTVIILGFSVYGLSMNLFKHKEAAIFTSFLVLVGATFSLGGNLMLYSYTLSSGLSFSLSVASFYFLLKKKPIYFSLLAGVATLVHFLLGGIAFGLLLLSNILANAKEKGVIKENLVSLIAYIPFSLAVLPILIRHGKSSISLSGEKIAEILGYIRAPHHYMPFTWGALQYIEFFLFFIIFILILRIANIEKKKKKMIKVFVSLIFLAFATYIVFSEIFPIGLIIKTHLFRMAPFLCLIEYLFIGNYIFLRAEPYSKERDWRALVILFLAISLFSNHLLLISAPFFVLFIVYKNKIRIKSKHVIIFLTLAIVLGIIMVGLYNKIIVSFLGLKINRLIILLFKLMIFIPLCAYLLFDKKKITYLFFLSIILSSLLFIIVKPNFLVYTYDQPASDLYGFIRSNTPKDAIFLTPPSLGTFRLGADRAIVVDYKSFPFEENRMLEWVERMQDISNHPLLDSEKKYSDIVEERYASLNENDIYLLRNKYNISYAVFYKPKNLTFPKEYENEAYIIYNIN